MWETTVWAKVRRNFSFRGNFGFNRVFNGVLASTGITGEYNGAKLIHEVIDNQMTMMLNKKVSSLGSALDIC